MAATLERQHDTDWRAQAAADLAEARMYYRLTLAVALATMAALFAQLVI